MLTDMSSASVRTGRPVAYRAPRSRWRRHAASTTIRLEPPDAVWSVHAPQVNIVRGRRRRQRCGEEGIRMSFIQRLGLRGLLSFPPDMEPFELQPLNVLIGPNGSGKTNVIEALELLHAAPTSIEKAIQSGGGISELVWKGDRGGAARISVELQKFSWKNDHTMYLIEVFDFRGIPLLNDEKMELIVTDKNHKSPLPIYQFKGGDPVISARDTSSKNGRKERKLEKESLNINESILSQIKEPTLYPELYCLGQYFHRMATFREWTFGTRSEMRLPQRVDDPSDALLPASRNLALVINEIHHRDHRAFDTAMKRFLPRYERMSTRIVGGTVQLFLHESGLRDPIPSTRISDGTLRFLAMLAVLLSPNPPPLLCLEEPELGLHPDAVALLAELLVQASSRMQLVVTTHSDALLSALNNQVESVLVCENNGHGTTIERLDAKRLTHWLKDYTLGDIWRIGELGGNP